MPKESKFIKGPDALHATKSFLPLLESEENYTKQIGKTTNQSGKASQLFIYKMKQNRTKSRKIRLKN